MANRVKDAAAIEHRLLELAHTTDAKITPASLAYFAPCSIEDAASVLDSLAARDRVSMDVEDDGNIVYQLHGRQNLGGHALTRHAGPPTLVPFTRPPRHASPLLAMVLSAFVPGAGHLYAERPLAAVLWLLVVAMGYMLILPGLVLHLFSIAGAASSTRRLNERGPRMLLAPASRY